MIVRRLPMLAVTLAAPVAIGVADARRRRRSPAATFATLAAPWMPAVPSAGTLTSTWFCPGVPAGGRGGDGG